MRQKKYVQLEKTRDNVITACNKAKGHYRTYSNGADNSKNKGQGVGGTIAAILLLTGVVALIITIATAIVLEPYQLWVLWA